MRLRPVAALACAAVLPACIPVVTHGPRVEDGPVSGVFMGLPSQPVLEGEVRTGQSTVTPVNSVAGVFARVGWTPETSGTPFPLSMGVSLPIALPFSITHPEVDLYAQATSPGQAAFAAGAGFLFSPSYTTPYVQAGLDLEGGASVYTTQSVALFHGGERAPAATVWMPAAAVTFSRYHVFLQAGLGRERLGPDSTRAVRFAMLGVVMETPSDWRPPWNNPRPGYPTWSRRPGR